MLRIILLLLSIFLIFPFTLNAQDSTDDEIKRIATELGEVLNRKRVKGKVIVFDFTDINGVPTELGAHIANKVSNRLVNVGVNYAIIDRGEVAVKKRSGGGGLGNLLEQMAGSETTREVLGYDNQTTAVESAAVVSTMLGSIPKKDKRIKGVDVIVYGTVTQIGERYHLDLKAKKKKGDVLIGTAEGDVSNTPELAALHGATLKTTGYSTASTPGPISFGSASTSQQFTKQNLQFDLIKCVTKGSSIEVHLRITSINKDDQLLINQYYTKIFNQSNGNEFRPSNINIADVTSTGNTTKKLIRNSPVQSVLTFYPGEDVAVISKLGISCNSQVFGNFYVELADIFVE